MKRPAAQPLPASDPTRLSSPRLRCRRGALRLIALLALAGPSARGAGATEHFQEHCASCHGPDGKARTPAGRKLGVKDLTESRIPEAEVVRQILDGAKDANGKPRMPPFREKFTADEVSALAAHVIALRRS